MGVGDAIVLILKSACFLLGVLVLLAVISGLFDERTKTTK